MRLAILVLVLLLVFVTLNYILKCLEYKDLQSVNEAYSRLYSKSKADVYDLEKQVGLLKSNLRTSEVNKEYYRDVASGAVLRENKSNDELLKCRHKIYVLKKDVKCKDRAIVRYKTQNEVFKHGYHESEKRNTKLEIELRCEQNVSGYYKGWYKSMQTERDAYLYCLRQIQEEVNNAKKE